ncbi:MAG: ABC transporter permease, partial [Ginsengibacter sp.]
IRNKKIGYDRDQVLVLHNTYHLGKQIKSFRQDLLNMPGVESASITSDLPTSPSFDQEGWFRDATFDATKAVIMPTFFVDENYIPTLGMQMVKGRNFSHDFPTDSTGIILNEAAVKLLGFKNPIGEIFYRPYDGNGNQRSVAFHVIGVVKDFNYSSLHENIRPIAMEMGENWGSMGVRVNSKDIPVLINKIESKWKTMAAGQPFSYTFMDADFSNIYNADQRTGKLFITFAIFAIFIGCLGLFGLVTYAAEQRTKEIGVRKVLGASVGGIVAMLSKDFAKLVLIASLIAFPVAWWVMNKWLQSFAYRTNISWWVFIIAGIVAIVIALITVSFQAIKAAIANPVKSLRTE